MRTLEDIVDSMERCAERGVPRGADAVLTSATAGARSHGNHRELTRWGAPVGVAAVLLIVVSIVLVARSRDVTVSTDTSLPPPATTEGAAIVPSIAVADGHVQLVRAGFGRLWVVSTDPGATPPSTKVRSFDPEDGNLLSEATVVGEVAHNGFGHTEDALWLRASTGGPAAFPIGTGGAGDNAIYRVDPTSGDAEAVAYLNGDGPIATSNQQVAAADVDHVIILDQSGDHVGASTIDDATGVENATVPGTNGILGLTYSTSSPPRLFARHQGRNELLELDPDTGAHLATKSLDAGSAAGVSIAASSDTVWLGRPGTVLGTAVPFGSRPPETRATPTVDGFPQLEIIADHHLAAWTPSAIALLDLAGTSIETTQMRSSETGDLLLIDGRLWIASWPSGDPGGPTTVTLTPGPGLSATQSETVVVPSVTRLLEIDEISIRTEIVDGETTDTLTDAVAHLPGTAAIGSPGVAVIVGHRTTYTAPFLRLDALQSGDHVTVIDGDRHMQFTVTSSRTVDAAGPSHSPSFGILPSDLEGPDDAAYLRLITFAPNYSDAQRLIVDAVLDDP